MNAYGVKSFIVRRCLKTTATSGGGSVTGHDDGSDALARARHVLANRGIKATWSHYAQADFEKSDHEEVLPNISPHPQHRFRR